jgi:hypothetical protein
LGGDGSIRDHSSSVGSVGYRFVLRSISAIRPRLAGVHIPSLRPDVRCEMGRLASLHAGIEG